MRRLTRLVRRVAFAVVFLALLVITLASGLLAVVQTSWGKRQIRDLIVSQAADFLTAELEIGELDGSLFRGVVLRDVRLKKDGQPIIAIDEVSVAYSIRELFQPELVVRRLDVVRPRVVAAKETDGRWNLGRLVKQQARDRDRAGPGRPIEIAAINVVDGDVVLRDPLMFGAARVPGVYRKLNAELAFRYRPVSWTIDFTHVSWDGGASDLSMSRLAGRLSNEADGIGFKDLQVETPASDLTLNGRIIRARQADPADSAASSPTMLDLTVLADRFAFQEWATVLGGLRDIAIDSVFQVRLRGPLAALETDLDLRSNGGQVKGTLTLDTSVPGWHGRGAVDLVNLDLASWFNNPERRSDISGRARFDLALRLGRGAPRGSYELTNAHASYLGYEGDRLRIRGDVTAREVLISAGTGVAYGAAFTLSEGAIGLASPYPFRFIGTATGLDLRRLPARVPVPHVESQLALAFTSEGQFVRPFLKGSAQFEESVFIGATVEHGDGVIDTSVTPFAYEGRGVVTGVDINRMGEALQVSWMMDPRYAGRVAGEFSVSGAGADAPTMTLRASGRSVDAEVFRGTLSDARVELDIHDGTLSGRYEGGFAGIDPSVPFSDARVAAVLTGTGEVDFTVRELLVKSPSLQEYEIKGLAHLAESQVRDVVIDRATMNASLSRGILEIGRADVSARDFSVTGSAAVDLQNETVLRLDHEASLDVAFLGKRFGQTLSGMALATGTVEGPFSGLRLRGNATLTRLEAPGASLLTTAGQYDAVVPMADVAAASGRVTARSSFLTVFNETFTDALWTVDYSNGGIRFDTRLTSERGPEGSIAGGVRLLERPRAIGLDELAGSIGSSSWRLLPSTPAPVVSWDGGGLEITPAAFVDATSGEQRIDVSGTWRSDGSGALRVGARNVFLETLVADVVSPSRYGGLLNLDATISGTIDRPIVVGQVEVTEGRVYRVSYERVAGLLGYEDGLLVADLRLDQAPGVWFTATGRVPPTLFSRSAPEMPVSLTVRSSRVDLGLVQGLTDAVRDVTGAVVANVDVVGTSRDPHLVGVVELFDASFVVSATGARYGNGSARFDLEKDRMTVAAFRLEDRNGHALRMSGSLGTHELRVGDVAIDVTARDFEVLRNQLGSMSIDVDVDVRGQLESPRVTGEVTIVRGEVRVDEVLSRLVAQPYATEAIPSPTLDPIRALSPWDRMTLIVNLHSQAALRMVGDSILVSENAPLGLGRFNIRASGDLFLGKEPETPLEVTGSLDSLTGTFEFQGRRFELYPSSSVDFRGALSPDVFLTVYRNISAVEARVTISGPVRQPELRLSSNPPLDPSDVLSLIVFNTTLNELSVAQRQELAVRAGTLAIGFLANALTSALERATGLDILEIEPTSGVDAGTKITVGEEIAPGLVARFSRHFGPVEYDEATIEYFLSRMLRIRATFSDAPALGTRSPFRRLERAGIDLIFLFSF